MRPYDWAELERDHGRAIVGFLILGLYVGALTLAGAGVWLLAVGRLVGWPVIALAVTVASLAWALGLAEEETP